MTFAVPAIAGAGIVSSVLGGFMGAEGTRQAGKASSAASYYQAAVAAHNAQIAEQQADRALAAGTVETQAVGLKSAANLGAIKAEQAASGIDVNTGSAVDVQASARMLGKQAADQTMNNAQERAWGYRVQAQNEKAQAQLDMMTGKNQLDAADTAATTQMIGALGTGLMGGAKALGTKWELLGG
jgi:hypothetical protein